MRVSVWYRSEEKQPDESGYYFTYRGWGMGGKADDDNDHGYLYYHKKTDKWYEYKGAVNSMHPNTCIVYYWSDADPTGWTDTDPPSIHIKQLKENPALDIAWKNVEEAIRQYRIVESLVR